MGRLEGQFGLQPPSCSQAINNQTDTFVSCQSAFNRSSLCKSRHYASLSMLVPVLCLTPRQHCPTRPTLAQTAPFLSTNLVPLRPRSFNVTEFQALVLGDFIRQLLLPLLLPFTLESVEALPSPPIKPFLLLDHRSQKIRGSMKPWIRVGRGLKVHQHPNVGELSLLQTFKRSRWILPS